MHGTISEASVIGLVTLFLGKLMIEVFIREKSKKKNITNGVYFSFFMTGFVLHFLIEMLGFNCWYCNKKCVDGLCNFV